MRYAIINQDNTVINHAEAEEDFAQSQGWIPALDSKIGCLWDGENFSPALEVITVPAQVTMRQARLALLQAGLLAGVDSTIASLPSPAKENAKIEWEYSQEVYRHNGFVSVLSSILGLTESQVDQLFILAKTL